MLVNPALENSGLYKNFGKLRYNQRKRGYQDVRYVKKYDKEFKKRMWSYNNESALSQLWPKILGYEQYDLPLTQEMHARWCAKTQLDQ